MKVGYSYDNYVADCKSIGLDPDLADKVKIKYNQENGTFIIWASRIPKDYMSKEYGK